MAMTRKPAVLVPVLLLPVLAILGLIYRAETVLQTGRKWVVKIGGYDPRDLLSGHYLRYRIRWDMQERESCQTCCYCLWNPGAPTDKPVEPAVRIVSCAERGPCESWFPEEDAAALEKYFIPETEGARLERALREKEAALLLSVSRRGRVGVEELLIDGRPWRELEK
jgi:uncharacterized membrane-anchored protein